MSPHSNANQARIAAPTHNRRMVLGSAATDDLTTMIEPLQSGPTMLPARPKTSTLRRRLRLAALSGLALCLINSSPANATGIIRDAETEALLRDYAKPIFNAAGLGAQGIKIHVVNDRAFNAFVVDGHNMFIHAGLIMSATTPNQVIGVIAHECGHIAGGHLARLRAQVARAQSAALMLQLLGLAAVAAGAATGSSSLGQVGMGGAMAAATRRCARCLRISGMKESSADQAGVRS